MTIQKGVITFTFLFDDEVYDPPLLQYKDIAEILHECDVSCEMVGHYESLVFSEVPVGEIEATLKAMGNDGTFFADIDEVAHAKMDVETD